VTVVFAGGGTGGHLYPAIAIADALRERSATIAFVGTADRLEASIVPKAGYRLYTIASGPLPRRPSLRLARTLGTNLKGTLQSLRLLAIVRPDLVIATGGYVAFPVVLAARIRRALRRCSARVVLLEPNARPGLTNRLLGPIVDEIWGGFAVGERHLGAKYERTGIPVRAALRALPTRAEASARLALDPQRPTLLAMGGSQGARAINDALVRLVRDDALPPEWQLLHLTGQGDYARVAAALHESNSDGARARASVRPYLDAMADAYAVADLVLARAGASTLAELTALGKPAVLVPYPFAAHQHQAANAARFASSGAAVVVTDANLADGALPEVLSAIAQGGRLTAMTSSARDLTGSDPLVAILARVETLLSRKSKR
jgi:UDP-N-acetylglucosamine--N-acetylmuramyl-(pentapeptide) pyrophosphoryl-undecaprenol N-acetylglucosamine transferase